MAFLSYIITLEPIQNMQYWQPEVHYAKLLSELVRHDGV